MTEDAENLILRLLRDLRSDIAQVRITQLEHGEGLTTLERRMVDVKESVALALGFSVSANAHYETSAERIDRLTETVADLKARLEKLEEKA